MNVCYFLKQRQVSEAWHTNLTHCFHQNSHSLPLTASEGLVRAGSQSGLPERTVPPCSPTTELPSGGGWEEETPSPEGGGEVVSVACLPGDTRAPV